MSRSETSIGQEKPRVPVRSIRTQVHRMVTLTTVSALAVACVLIITYQYVNYRRTIVERSSALAEMIAVNSPAVLTSQDADAARELLRACAKNPEILSARLYTADSEVLAEYVRPGGVVPPFPLTVLREGHVVQGSQLILRYPITVEDKVIGLVGVRADMRAELQHLQLAIVLVLVCMALAAAVSSVVARRLLREILEPVLDLAGVAAKVTQTNDYSLRAMTTSRNEIGALTATFNNMLAQIQQRDKEVSEAYDELTQATSHLQVSEEQFRQLAENIREVFWMTNPDKSQMLYISPAYATVWGRSCESVVQEPLTWVAAIHPEDRARVTAALPAQVTGEYDVEYRIGRPDGSERWIHDRAFPIRDATGKVYRLAGIAEDVTERKEIEVALRNINEVLEQRVRDRTAELADAEQRMRLAVEATAVGIWEWNLTTNRIRWDAQMFRNYGITPAAEGFVEYTEWSTAVLPEELAQQEALLQDTVRRKGHGTREFRIRRRNDGQVRILQAVETVRTDARGQVEWVVGTNLDITERKQAEEQIRQLNAELEQRVRERTAELESANAAVRESEVRLRQAIQAGDVGLWDWDLTTNKVAFSTRWKAQIGYTEAEIVNDFNEWQSRVHPDDLEPTLRHVREVLANPACSYRVEFRFRHKAGSYRWIMAQASVLRDAAGKPLRMLGSHIDITPLKQIEEQLSTAEAKYRLLVERVPAVTYTAELGAGGRWHYVSPQIESLLGFTPAEWLADPHLWHRQVLPADRANVLLHDAVARRTGHYDTEYRILTRAGATIWVQDTGVFMDSAAGLPPLLQGVLLEITARKLAEKAARESQERLQAILDNSPAMIFMKDTAGKYLLVNRQFELLIHMQMAEVIGKTDFDLLPPATAETFRKNDQRVLAEKQSLQFEEVAPNDKNLHTYVSVKFPIFNAAGEPIAVCGISTDISDRQSLQRQLLEVSDREQRRIGQDLHDGLCQLLTGTAFAAKALEERLRAAGLAEVKDVAKILKLVQRANVQARNVARGLYPVELQVGGLVGAVRELAYSFTQIYRVDCQVDCDEDCALPDSAQAVHLYRIFQEAMTNAVKHGKANQIVIRLAADAGTLTLSVADNGSGLPTAAEHTGMGLNIMEYRARMIGGTLKVARRHAGGTVVELVCPLG